MKKLLYFFLSIAVCISSAAQTFKKSLLDNDILKPGQFLYSPDGQVKLGFQDNKLVAMKGSVVLWHSDHWNPADTTTQVDQLNFQKGEINTSFKGKAVWSSQTLFPGSRMIIDNDGILKIVTSDNMVLWENLAGTANSMPPPLVSGGDEGPYRDSMVKPTDKMNLFVMFVDWPDAKATETNFDSLWHFVSGNGELVPRLEQQGRHVNFKVETKIHRAWATLPRPISFYFPATTGDGEWNWQVYIKDCPELLPRAFGVDSFTNNSIAIFIANPSAARQWKAGVPNGNHPINFHGLKSMIALKPPGEGRKYTMVMHEIGHSYGTDELYADDRNWYATEIMGLDVMGESDLSTGFMGYHRYRYGWMPFHQEKPTSVYLIGAHSYGVTLTPLSADRGINMILIPDASVSPDSLGSPHKLWGIEIGQDVQSLDQFYAGKNEKAIREGEKIIIYTVDSKTQPDKRLIRLVPKKVFDKDKDKWRETFLYKDGDTFQNASAPMDIKIHKNPDGSYYLAITMKPRR